MWTFAQTPVISLIWAVPIRTLLLQLKYVAGGGVDGSGMHAIAFYDGALILSDDQVTRLASALMVNASTLPEIASVWSDEPVTNMRRLMNKLAMTLPKTSIAPKVEPCAWNMMFARRCVVLDGRLARAYR